jgi:hypothetical protein
MFVLALAMNNARQAVKFALRWRGLRAAAEFSEMRLWEIAAASPPTNAPPPSTTSTWPVP